MVPYLSLSLMSLRSKMGALQEPLEQFNILIMYHEIIISLLTRLALRRKRGIIFALHHVMRRSMVKKEINNYNVLVKYFTLNMPIGGGPRIGSNYFVLDTWDFNK